MFCERNFTLLVVIHLLYFMILHHAKDFTKTFQMIIYNCQCVIKQSSTANNRDKKEVFWLSTTKTTFHQSSVMFLFHVRRHQPIRVMLHRVEFIVSGENWPYLWNIMSIHKQRLKEVKSHCLFFGFFIYKNFKNLNQAWIITEMEYKVIWHVFIKRIVVSHRVAYLCLFMCTLFFLMYFTKLSLVIWKRKQKEKNSVY